MGTGKRAYIAEGNFMMIKQDRTGWERKGEIRCIPVSISRRSERNTKGEGRD